MTTVIRQKLGCSKTRLLKKIDEISSVCDGEEKISKYDAGRFLLELEKKLSTFKKSALTGHFRKVYFFN